MIKSQRVSLFLLRLTMGWLFLYAGITKVFDPTWSAEGYLKGAKTFIGFYNWLASPEILPFINLINEWGLTLLGLALILGIWVRLSSFLGLILMALYYIPILDFPYPNPHSFIVDEHIVYIFSLLVLFTFRAGKYWGIDKKLSKN